jgi:hypothetical protein
VESDSSRAVSKSQNNCPGKIVSCDPQELRPHRSYARHGLTVPAAKLSAVRARGELAFLEPITITHQRTIIDGYARWQLAKELKLPFLHCLEYQLAETEALEWLLQKHRRSNGMNDFSRIMLSLDLEPELTEKARTNKQLGGQHKGWSNLTKAEQVQRHRNNSLLEHAATSVFQFGRTEQCYFFDDVGYFRCLQFQIIAASCSYLLEKIALLVRSQYSARVIAETVFYISYTSRAERQHSECAPGGQPLCPEPDVEDF